MVFSALIRLLTLVSTVYAITWWSVTGKLCKQRQKGFLHLLTHENLKKLKGFPFVICIGSNFLNSVRVLKDEIVDSANNTQIRRIMTLF